MVIFDARGVVVGRMVGKTDIQTSDPVLARIWSDEIKPLAVAVASKKPDPSHGLTASPCSDPAWMQKVSALLASHGYRAEPVL